MVQKTAVDWLFEQIPAEWTSTKYAFDAYQQAKQIEKEQIENAFLQCWIANMPDGYECKKSATEYYNETYGED